MHVSGDAQDFPDARQGRWLRSEGAADQAGHDIGVSVDVYTQSTLNAKLELVNRLEQSLLESFNRVQSETLFRKSLKNKIATLAQLVERLIRNQQVAGSTPAGGSIFSIRYGKMKEV